MNYFYVMEKGKLPESVLVPEYAYEEEMALNLVKMKFHKNYIRGSFDIITYVATNEDFNSVIKCPKGTTPKEALEAINNNGEEHFTKIRLLEEDEHTCKYCGNIAKGTYEDILCEECRECFGHTLYSEL